MIRLRLWLWATPAFLLGALFTGVSTGDETPAPQPVPGDPQVRPADDGALFNGKNLDGWRIAKTQDFEHQTPVAVENGAMVLALGQPASGVVWKGRPPRENFEVSLEAKRLKGNDFFCGLTFPVGDSYCTLIVGGWGGGTTGLSNLDGYSAVENETSGYTEFKQDQWYRIRVRVTDQSVSAAIDDEELFTVPRKNHKFSIWWEQEPMRPLGVAAWRTQAAIRNVRLKALQPATQEGRSTVD